MELILEKTTLPSQLPRIARPRLLSMLCSSLESCASTVISGRAGTGKTALAVSFAQICSRPVAWYKVDASDLDLRVFFEYLVVSIQQQRPEFNKDSIMSLVGTAKSDRVQLLAETFVYELLEGEGNPLLIAIEDLHQVCDAEWLVPFLCRFLPLLPRDVHVLITSRTLPPAPLWRMRSKQTLEVIDEATLGFTPEETLELFETYGLSGEHAGLAFEHTNGRAGALVAHAAALSKSHTAYETRPDPNGHRLVDQRRTLRLVGPTCLDNR